LHASAVKLCRSEVATRQPASNVTENDVRANPKNCFRLELEGQITIVLESTSHEKTGATGACVLEACVSRMTFDKSGLCADPEKLLEMPQLLVRNRPTRV
jgi:hypothetical protein